MSEEKGTQVKVYVDGKDIGEVNRVERGDVVNTIKGYGGKDTNPTPGYNAKIDLTNYDFGNHTLKIEVYDESENLITSTTRNITKRKPETWLYVEKPFNNGESFSNTLNLQGWIMSEEKGTQVKVYVDGKDIGEVNRVERGDVVNTIKGYGGKDTNPTPGYNAKIDLTNYDFGNHTLKIEVYDESENLITSTTRNITKRKPETWLYVEKPFNNGESFSNTLNLQGWIMSEEKGTQVKVYVDGKDIGEVNRVERGDVVNTIKGYGGKDTNPTPGYNAKIDLTNYDFGNHTLKIEAICNGKIIISINKLFRNEKPNTLIQIESLYSNINSNKFTFYGWVMTESSNYSLGILVDGKKFNSSINRIGRGDVTNIIKGYGGLSNNPMPGFTSTIDLSSVKDGTHSIGIVLYSKRGEVITSKTSNYKIKKYIGKIEIESPVTESLSASNNIDVHGWTMSTNLNDNIKIYVDDKLIDSKIYKSGREDVIAAIKDYGDASINPTPGFSTEINLSDFVQGYHTLKIAIYDDIGDLIVDDSKRFYLYKKMLGIDVSYHQKNINWGTVRRSGAVDFAIIRLGYRGYGTGVLSIDTNFKNNINSAYDNGIKVGTYFFSQAKNYNEGAEEADFVIKNLNLAFPGYEKKLSFPIVIDTEYSNSAHSGRADEIGKIERTNAILGFCDKIKTYGLKPMIYSNPNFIKNELNMSKLSNIDLWLSHYTGSIDNASYYSDPYFIWQYTSSGQIPGINTLVDLDLVM